MVKSTVPTHNSHSQNNHTYQNSHNLFALTKVWLFWEKEDSEKIMTHFWRHKNVTIMSGHSIFRIINISFLKFANIGQIKKDKLRKKILLKRSIQNYLYVFFRINYCGKNFRWCLATRLLDWDWLPNGECRIPPRLAPIRHHKHIMYDPDL